MYRELTIRLFLEAIRSKDMHSIEGDIPLHVTFHATNLTDDLCGQLNQNGYVVE